MPRPSTSSERTPLVQPTYVYDSKITRRYQQRLRNFQCVICMTFLVIFTIAILLTVSYKLSEDTDLLDNVTELPTSESNPALPVRLQPLLQMKWPLAGKPPATWVGDPPSPEEIAAAVEYGKSVLEQRSKEEALRKPLDPNTSASRAQRASATAAYVKPMADAAYAVEHATRALINKTDYTKRDGGVGVGPKINGGFLEPPYCAFHGSVCPKTKYRTLNGSCNNLKHPQKWGVANTPFRRVLPADYGDGISSPRTGVGMDELPSARDVSVTVHRPSYAQNSVFTVMLAVWGQFIDHDITATATSKGVNSSALSCCDPSQPEHSECFPVKIDPEDPYYQDYQLTCMEFVRSASAYTCHFGPREQLNQASAFLDGSVVYGNSETKASRIRSFSDGLLKMLEIDGRELLPQATDPDDGCNTAEMNAKGRYCFESGDDRSNENLHLTTMHLIWARQHNTLARELKVLNPDWDDETLYQEARKIVGAQMQHITYKEFLPAILGDDVMMALNLSLGSHHVYNSTMDPSIANHFSAAVFRFAHTLLPGLIHNTELTNGSVGYVHLHEILFNPYQLYGVSGPKAAVTSAAYTPIHTVDPHVTTELSNHLFEHPVTMTNTTLVNTAASCGLDLVSLNIQRGRDHGLPSYPAWREHCGFPRPKTFEDLADVFDVMSLGRIKQIYMQVEDIDMYTGLVAETPNGRLLGPTLTCLISDQFLRVRYGDRYWYETTDPITGFTKDQLIEIRKTTLAGVICANEGMLNEIQPKVMEEISLDNPLMDCREIPQPDLTPWRLQPKIKS